MARSPLFQKLKTAVRKSSGFSSSVISASRRDFLKSTGLAVATLSIPAVGNKLHDGTEVVILGGGISGLGAAVQLQEWDVPYRLFEASSRLGGRMHTQDGFNEDGQFVELGGELVDKNHNIMIQWAKKLGLELDYLLENRGQSDLDIIYVGGQYYNDEQFARELSPLIAHVRAAVEEMRRGLPQGAQLGYWHRHHPGVLKYDNMTLTEFLDSMNDVDPWIKDTVAIAYRAEFGLEADHLGAIALLDMIDDNLEDGFSLFGTSDEAYRIRGGSSRFIEKLFERAFPKGQSDPQLHLEHELIAIRERKSQIELTFKVGEGTKVYMADRVICTIPFSALREVQGISSMTVSPVKKRAIMNMNYGTHSKIMLDFKERFWMKMGNRAVGGAYIFTDLSSQCYWETSRAQKGGHGILTSFLAGHNGKNAALPQIEITLNDLSNIYRSPRVALLAERPDGITLRSSMANWSQRKFQKGSYCCLTPGQVTGLWGDNHTPELGGRLIFAGEHTSLDMNGYMSGALDSGIRAARQARKSVSFWV